MGSLTERDTEEFIICHDIPSDQESIDGLEDDDIEVEVCLNDGEFAFNLNDYETTDGVSGEDYIDSVTMTIQKESEVRINNSMDPILIRAPPTSPTPSEICDTRCFTVPGS